MINQVRSMRNTIGTICDPNTAWMLLRSLETLELRMNRAGENAAKLCEFLRTHPKVEKVGYLGFLEDELRQADVTVAIAPAPGLPSRSISREAKRRRSPFSTRCASPISQSAWGALRRWRARQRR